MPEGGYSTLPSFMPDLTATPISPPGTDLIWMSPTLRVLFSSLPERHECTALMTSSTSSTRSSTRTTRCSSAQSGPKSRGSTFGTLKSLPFQMFKVAIGVRSGGRSITIYVLYRIITLHYITLHYITLHYIALQHFILYFPFLGSKDKLCLAKWPGGLTLSGSWLLASISLARWSGGLTSSGSFLARLRQAAGSWLV